MPNQTPYMKFNGFDILKYVEIKGLNISENDLDAPNSGRTLDGKMWRGKVTSKFRADIKLVDATIDFLNTFLPIIRNQYFTLQTNLFPGREDEEIEMYNSTRKYGIRVIDTDGKPRYEGTSFNVIER